MTCITNYLFWQNGCFSPTCPETAYGPSGSINCATCIPGCLLCDDANTCTTCWGNNTVSGNFQEELTICTCKTGFFYDIITTLCVIDCSTGYYEVVVEGINSCVLCSASCTACESVGKFQIYIIYF